MHAIRKGWKGLMVALLVAFVFLSSGCALFLVGAGAGGGYMIRKGEEGNSQKKKESSQRQEMSPSMERNEYLVAYAPIAGER